MRAVLAQIVLTSGFIGGAGTSIVSVINHNGVLAILAGLVSLACFGLSSQVEADTRRRRNQHHG